MQFTDGQISRFTSLAAPDLISASMKASQLAKDIMQQKPFGDFDWRKWRIIIATADEGRFEEAFPTCG